MGEIGLAGDRAEAGELRADNLNRVIASRILVGKRFELFGRGPENNWLYLTSSDMERVTGYVYRARLAVPGIR